VTISGRKGRRIRRESLRVARNAWSSKGLKSELASERSFSRASNKSCLLIGQLDFAEGNEHVRTRVLKLKSHIRPGDLVGPDDFRNMPLSAELQAESFMEFCKDLPGFSISDYGRIERDIRASVPSLKSLEFRRRSVGFFKARAKRPYLSHTGRASNAEKQPTGRGPEGCVETLKMGRLLRCSSVTYRSGYAP
jgi:hypothetical protein